MTERELLADLVSQLDDRDRRLLVLVFAAMENAKREILETIGATPKSVGELEALPGGEKDREGELSDAWQEWFDLCTRLEADVPEGVSFRDLLNEAYEE
jgi:hypothetical protein